MPSTASRSAAAAPVQRRAHGQGQDDGREHEPQQHDAARAGLREQFVGERGTELDGCDAAEQQS